jgi:UDP:flavonoid glycosyltransferase YjiC (YdhE family)
MRLTGFPLYDESGLEPLAGSVEQFLRAGEPPIAFTPGSAMWVGRPFFEASAEACRRIGRRGILLSRHRDHIPPNLPPGVIHVDYAPFSELLPRCAALVHHGGIGTSSQALAAGVRQIVMPMAHDQYDNANRLKRLGVARVIPAKHYHGPGVAKELAALLNSPEIASSCRAVAARFEGTKPLQETCDLIEQLVMAGRVDGH